MVWTLIPTLNFLGDLFMKVFFTDHHIVHSPESLIMLLQRRITLIWNYRIVNVVQKVVFKSMDVPYEVVRNGKMYIIYFSNDVLLDLVRPGKGISDFDRYLKEIENHLICQL